jgi:hypothetical protein
MKCLSIGLYALALFSFFSSLTPVKAQTSAIASGAVSSLGYDASREVTLNGVVSTVLMRPSGGMIPGSHLLLATLSGPLDASLGIFGLRGKGAVTVVAGQQIEVTGVMRTLQDKGVLVVRTVKAGGEVYTIRNEHGFPVPPQARMRTGQKTAGGPYEP